MKNRLIKCAVMILVTAMICLCSASCSSKERPKYLLKGSEDNGLVPSYRAYFSIDGNKAEKISESEFEGLIHDDKSDYKLINEDIYSIDAHADSSDPSEWEFEEYKDYFDDIDTLEIDTLKEYLKEMGVSFTGAIHVEIREFDDYTALEVDEMDDITVAASASGLFKNGKMIDIPEDVTFRSVDDVYMLEK